MNEAREGTEWRNGGRMFQEEQKAHVKVLRKKELGAIHGRAKGIVAGEEREGRLGRSTGVTWWSLHTKAERVDVLPACCGKVLGSFEQHALACYMRSRETS